MVQKNQEKRGLVTFVDSLGSGPRGGLTGAELAIAYKAALSDFVLGKASRGAIAEVSRLLSGAISARRQELAELEETSSNRIHNYF